MKKGILRNVAVVGIMAALSAILMLLEFPVGLIPGFIKLDFSDIPALLVSFSAGPLWGAAVCLVKNVINLPLSETGGVGELANLLVSLSLVMPAGIVYRYAIHTKKGALLGCGVGSAAMAAVSVPVNYFLSFPFYEKLFGIDVVFPFTALYPPIDNLLEVVLLVMLPFNLVKATVVSVLTMLVYKRISPLLKGRK